MGGNVFANGLEISGKAVNAQTIAAMPDVCFTPPENPATPPGVPIPYPSFGMASDTESGTGTVFISGKTVNIKNKSDESKTSGTEAGCAAKKGVITSKNTGKKYFNSWSNDVKFDGEPVIRFSDLATHNHASPVGNTPPIPEIAALNMSEADCKTLLMDYDMYPVPYGQLKCPESDKGEYWKEHTVENQFFACRGLRKMSSHNICKHWKDYTDAGGECFCMHSTHPSGSTKGTDHKIKTAQCADALKETPCMTLDKFMDTCVEATMSSFEKTKNMDKDDPKRKQLASCLKDKNKKAIDKQLTEENKKNSDKKQQGKLSCHAGGGGCENREHHGKTPTSAISDAAAGRLQDAKAAGRCP